MRTRCVFAALMLVTLGNLALAQEPGYTRTEDVIYGRKFGLAMTMDVFQPKEKASGAGVIFCVSGGWFSAKAAIRPAFYEEFLKRGYVVFAVVHGSQPRFTIPEVLEDMHRAVRFIRHNAKTYGVDKERLAICGGSAGGHLSLMQGVAGSEGNPKATDPVELESSKVAVVGCFFPPTDFLNYGKPGENALGTGTLQGFRPPFDFHIRNPKTGAFDRITDEEQRNTIGKKISPVYFASASSAPALIIHGDADKLVPIQQGELMIEALRKTKVPCELVVKKEAGHGWAGMDQDLKLIADWFDRHLETKKN
jgi:acetyl esterase/lipase